jgi:hypothetical protein
MKRCRILVDLEDEFLGPFCNVRDAKRAVECGRKIRFAPIEMDGCTRAWDVQCGGEVVGEACDRPRNRPLAARRRR